VCDKSGDFTQYKKRFNLYGERKCVKKVSKPSVLGASNGENGIYIAYYHLDTVSISLIRI